MPCPRSTVDGTNGPVVPGANVRKSPKTASAEANSRIAMDTNDTACRYTWYVLRPGLVSNRGSWTSSRRRPTWNHNTASAAITTSTDSTAPATCWSFSLDSDDEANARRCAGLGEYDVHPTLP